MTDVRVGIFAPVGQFAREADQRESRLNRIAAAHVDHFCVNDHYVEAGCSVFNVIPCADAHETAVSGVAELRRLLSR
jgi:hypothetical protein